jgi:hypothetical protein
MVYIPDELRQLVYKHPKYDIDASQSLADQWGAMVWFRKFSCVSHTKVKTSPEMSGYHMATPTPSDRPKPLLNKTEHRTIEVMLLDK